MKDNKDKYLDNFDCDCEHEHDHCDCEHEHCDCEHEHDHCDCKHEHDHCDCEHEHDHCDCEHEHYCVLEPDQICTNCGECLVCDLDPNKMCDNCGKCLDSFNTDEKGYVSVKIDKIIREGDDPTLEELYKQYGLLDEDDDL